MSIKSSGQARSGPDKAHKERIIASAAPARPDVARPDRIWARCAKPHSVGSFGWQGFICFFGSAADLANSFHGFEVQRELPTAEGPVVG